MHFGANANAVISGRRFPSERFRVIRSDEDFYEVRARVRVAHARHPRTPAASTTVAPSAERMVLTRPSFATAINAMGPFMHRHRAFCESYAAKMRCTALTPQPA